MKAILAKLSVCRCGFPLLRDEIELGAEYEVDTRYPEDDFQMICGGCHKVLSLRGLFFKAKGQSHGGYLPKEAFQIA